MKICVTRSQTPDAQPKICVSPNAKPRRQSVEYRLRWVFWRWPCIFHVYFMLFVHLFPRWQRENQATQRQISLEYRLKKGGGGRSLTSPSFFLSAIFELIKIPKICDIGHTPFCTFLDPPLLLGCKLRHVTIDKELPPFFN